MKFPPACPEIPVGELAPALAYYSDCLGFTIDWSDEELGLAGLSQGASRLFMGGAHYRAHQGTRGPLVIWLNMSNREEVDALYARWQGNGAKIDAPPGAKSWNLYEFLAADLDGNVLRVFYDFAWEGRQTGT